MRKFAAAAMALLLLVVMASPARCQLGQSAHPRLVLVMIIDQFSYDYLTRFADKYGSNGFRYIQDHGANFTNCRYRQATTVTAVGHSVIASGAYPWASGVVSNEWYDRRKSAELPAVYDESVQLVGANGTGASCRNMNGTTFGDELRLATNGRSKVFAMSLKDRGALFLAGKLGNGAYWFDPRTGSFISSSQFGAALPTWVRNFNDRHYADQFFGKAWQRLLPETAYTASTRDDYTFEGALPADGKQFPHVLTAGATSPNEAYYNTFAVTPFANDMLADLARAAIEGEALGQHSDPDVLSVSFSSSDKAGHLFGPYSQEVEDLMLRLDQTIGSLLKYADSKVGLNNTLVIVTGDHGNEPIPEFLKERGGMHGLDAGRIDPKSFKTLLNSALSSRLGQGDWIASFTPPNLYLNLSEIDKQKYRQPEVEALAAKLAHSIPGVAEVYTAAQFYTNQLPSGPYQDAVRRSYYWGRSGELYIMTKPGYIWSGDSIGTSHGSAYAYDQQVPLLVMGPGIEAGKFSTEASPADIAPTVAALLGVQLPQLCEGRALSEAMGQVSGPPLPMSARMDSRVTQIGSTGNAH